MGAALHLAFIGYGEVGQLFARQLMATPDVIVSAFDIKLTETTNADPMREIARQDGVRLNSTAAEAIRGASIIFSAVTADATEMVARGLAPVMKAGQVLVDVNSASPASKARAAAYLEALSLDYVEAAVMAPVAEPGIGVSILAGGARANEIAALLNPLGMRIRVVSQSIGRASATKLCRSIMIKGIEALIIDCQRAARHWGVDADVFASLDASFPGTDWTALAATMDARVARHGIRRAAEMREAAAMLEEMGLEPGLSDAIAVAHDRRARQKP